MDGAADRHGHLVDGGDAFPGVDEEPLPVECHHLHVQRLDAGMSGMVRMGLHERADRIGRGHAADSDGGQRNDDDQRNGPQGDLRPGGTAGVGCTSGRDVACPIAPGKEQHQADDGHDDQQHQPRDGQQEVLAGLGHAAGRIRREQVAAGGQACNGQQGQQRGQAVSSFHAGNGF